VDSFTGLLNLYETASDDSGQSLAAQLQSDWGVFSFDNSDQILAFIRSSGIADHDLVQPEVRVRLKGSGVGQPADHITAWQLFSDEIRLRNRYFPSTVPDRGTLEQVLTQAVVPLAVETPLYRARICDGDADLGSNDMGAPPANKAAAGRANPVGIPYLYLAFETSTCVYEIRPTAHSCIAIGTFELAGRLEVLDLSEVKPLDYFDIVEIDDVEEQVQRVFFHRYLTALGDELSKPVRTGDRPTDYIPTQYLCELAKSFGLGGVIYGSSVLPSGHNVVLFDVTAAECASVEIVEVTGLTIAWAKAATPARQVVPIPDRTHLT
jgi:RES domain-containing protein